MRRSVYVDDLELVADAIREDEQVAEPDPLDAFFADGTITEVLGELKSGKEGTIYACRAHPSTGEEIVAAKVYRARTDRAFKNDAVYSEGRSFGKRRENLAVKNKSRLGREIQFGAWLAHEWSMLSTLFGAGAAVPRPIARAEGAILMQLVGDERGPAFKLHEVRLSEDEVRPIFQTVMANIELFLRCNIVHSDLSPYNILYWKGEVTVIDFPQAVDPRSNTRARELLTRDLTNVCGYFERHGMRLDPERMSHFLWGKFMRMEL